MATTSESVQVVASLARFLYEHPAGGDEDGPWGPARKEWYERFAADTLAYLGRYIDQQANIAHASRYGTNELHSMFHSCPCRREAIVNLAQEAEAAAQSGGHPAADR